MSSTPQASGSRSKRPKSAISAFKQSAPVETTDVKPAVEDEGTGSLDGIFKDALSSLDTALDNGKLGWALQHSQVAIHLHDIYKTLRHWNNDIYNSRADVLKTVENGDFRLSETIRSYLKDVATAISDLRSFYQDYTEAE